MVEVEDNTTSPLDDLISGYGAVDGDIQIEVA